MMSGKTYAELLDELDPEERKRLEHRAAGLIAEERRRESTGATLTREGQTTIPKEIREALRMKPGDRMTFTLLPDSTILVRVKNKSAMSVAGRFFKKGRKALPVEDLSRR
jgi:antitoxin PrlF